MINCRFAYILFRWHEMWHFISMTCYVIYIFVPRSNQWIFPQKFQIIREFSQIPRQKSENKNISRQRDFRRIPRYKSEFKKKMWPFHAAVGRQQWMTIKKLQGSSLNASDYVFRIIPNPRGPLKATIHFKLPLANTQGLLLIIKAPIIREPCVTIKSSSAAKPFSPRVGALWRAST